MYSAKVIQPQGILDLIQKERIKYQVAETNGKKIRLHTFLWILKASKVKL